MYSKADTHIHTTFSDGLFSPQELVEHVAAEKDMAVIAITDHNTAEGALLAADHAQRLRLPLEVIVGQEVTTDEGDIVGLFLERSLPAFRRAADAIDAIHAQGGLAIAVHPFCYWSSFRQMLGVGRRIAHLPLDGVEVRNGFPTSFASNRYAVWFNRRRGQTISELGGSDSHVPYTVGQSFTWFPGRTTDDLRQAVLERTTQAGGSLWRAGALARTVPAMLQRGLPRYEKNLVYADELPGFDVTRQAGRLETVR